MKLFLLLIASIPFVLQAQDCKPYRDTDPYTHETRISSGIIPLQGASVIIAADKNELDFFFTIPGACFNDASTVFIYFEGSKSRITYRNNGSMNCDGYFHFIFRTGTTPGALQKLSTQKLANLIFTGTDKKQIVVSLLTDQQQHFMEMANCMLEESRLLIKK